MMIRKFLLSFIIIFITFFSLACSNNQINLQEQTKGLYIIKLNSKMLKGKIIPYVSDGLDFNSSVFVENKAKISVNAGFFDPFNKKTTSYVIKNSKIIADPSKNENLVNNPALKPFLDKIFNRTEFRVLNCEGQEVYDIVEHNSETSCKIVHSIQAGPLIYPKTTLEKEYFISYKNNQLARDPLRFLNKIPRTAIGIKDNDVYLIVATIDNPLSIYDLYNLANDLKLDKLMGFDGGGSTSLNYKNINVVSDKDLSARKLKSFLLIF